MVLLRCAALLLCCVGSGALAHDDATDGSEPFAFEVPAINTGLAPAEPPLQLDTPRTALESYLDAIGRQEFTRAAHALNLNALPANEQAERAPTLALMLAFVLRRNDLVDWAEIPDQPDARVVPGLQQSVGPYSRRSLPLGEVVVDGRPVPISLQRFRPGDGEAVWLFSPFVVDRALALYEASRPGLFSDWVPLERRVETLGQPSAVEWFAAAVLLAGAGVVWVVAYASTRVLFKRRRGPARWIEGDPRTAVLVATALAAGAFAVGTNHLFLLTGPVASRLGGIAEVVTLGATAWLLLQILSVASRSLSERYVVPLPADDPHHRRTKTTIYVVRRVTLVVIALLAVAYILVKTGIFQDFGLSILASAGALGVLVTIAARPLLSNMVAGLQIALTDPVRVGDVVVYGEHWATVEDIAFAHTVLRTWTDTRLIVPHADFLARPFENWSKEGEAVWRIVKLPVDYRVDVEVIRGEVAALVDDDARSCQSPRVELVDADADAAVVWIWICGTTALTSWTLHNDVRERLIAFLKGRDAGAWLPRRRHVVAREGTAPPPSPSALGQSGRAPTGST
jgi:small-conductance mechanosensitive channel